MHILSKHCIYYAFIYGLPCFLNSSYPQHNNNTVLRNVVEDNFARATKRIVEPIWGDIFCL